MEGLKSFFTTLKGLKERLRKIEETGNTYLYPFPEDTVVRKTEEQSPAHTGAFRGAVDFVVDLGTPIVCPLGGEVVKVVDSNDKFGPTKDFAPHLNYLTIKHANGEFSQLAHLAKGSASVREGDHVVAGQTIGITGNSGWMTEPHLHFFVFKRITEAPGFVGLKIRFRGP